MPNKLALAVFAVLPLVTSCAVDLDPETGADSDDLELTADHAGPIFLHPHGDDHADCTRSRPCATFARANELLADDVDNLIVLAPGQYSQSIVLQRGATIAGTGAWLVVPATANVAVQAGYGRITLRGITLFASRRQPIRCGFGGVALIGVDTNAPILCDVLGRNDVALTDVHTSAAIAVRNGVLAIDRSEVIGGGGVTVVRSGYSITNSLFAQMAAPVTFSGQLGATQSHRFELNTVVDNGRGITGLAAADLQCVDGAPSNFSNNIVWTSWQPPYGVIASRGCQSTYSIVWNYAGANVDPMLDEAYHLQPHSPAIDAGDPGIDQRTDLDGEPVDGPRADIGADEYIP